MGNQKGVSLVGVLVAIGIMGMITGYILQISSESMRLQNYVLVRQSILTTKMAVVELLSTRAVCAANFQNIPITSLPLTLVAPNGLRTAAGVTVFTPGQDLENGKYQLTAIRLANWRAQGTVGADQFKGAMDLIVDFKPAQGISLSRVIQLSVELKGFTVGQVPANEINSCASVGNDINQPWTVTASSNIVYMGGNVGIDEPNPTQRLQVNGFVLAAGYLYPSDRRLKKDIEPSGGLEIIEKIRGVRYRWKKSGELSNGVIAQELEAVMPEAVVTSPSGQKSVNYSSLIAPLIESSRQLAEANRELKAELAQRQLEIQVLRDELQKSAK